MPIRSTLPALNAPASGRARKRNCPSMGCHDRDPILSTTAEPTTEAPTQPEADPVTSSGDLVTTDTPRPSDDTVSCASLDSNKLRSLNDDISVKPIEDPEIAEAVEKMNEVDPWLARKQREQQQS